MDTYSAWNQEETLFVLLTTNPKKSDMPESQDVGKTPETELATCGLL
jgi:hypothetical protein